MTNDILERPPDPGKHQPELHETKLAQFAELAALDDQAGRCLEAARRRFIPPFAVRLPGATPWAVGLPSLVEAANSALEALDRGWSGVTVIDSTGRTVGWGTP